MERTKGTLALLLGRVALLLGGRARRRRPPPGGDGSTARDILNQPPRPLRGDDGPPAVRTPRW
ncbi:hypothetical protein P8A18_01790 [Streptomyces castrisilvae]|uniref:Uncharacterized protein n=1 Tax=Streptomyces castrisilvae TaxID=3033811 RepID=A0ABY9HCL4_9ACTN|nr:hypothetical protein [Streptomyces sp. Mut1]WLQ32253.1 hypothetical protein P8A18_01790 [Streptomyces sp. Mut1]